MFLTHARIVNIGQIGYNTPRTHNIHVLSVDILRSADISERELLYINNHTILMAAKEYLTKEKFEELQKELHTLKTEMRTKIAQELEFAKSLGDLSENAEYHEAREDQAALEDRISQLETILASAEIVAVHHSNSVEIGSKAHVQKKGDASPRAFILVGSEEIDTAQGKISFKSPLGSALLGKKKGETFTCVTPAGEFEYTVTSIE